MTLLELPVVRRQPLQGITEAYSAATLERVELADGQRFVLKHLPAEGDWLTRASGGTDRMRRLWDSGLLARVGSVVDHTVVDVLQLEGHDVVVMRDAADQLLASDTTVTRSTSRQLLAGLAALHDRGTEEPVQQLCPIGARYGMFAPAVLDADPGPGAHPSRDFIIAGWDLFEEHVASDVVAEVFRVHRDPNILGRRLARFPSTVLHGDAKLGNLGIGASGLVAVDWGDLTGFGPPEIDVAWYALMNTTRIGGSPDDAFEDYEAAARHPLDREALDLACIGSLAQMGFKLATVAVKARQPHIQAAAAALAWWTARVRSAVERVGPL